MTWVLTDLTLSCLKIPKRRCPASSWMYQTGVQQSKRDLGLETKAWRQECSSGMEALDWNEAFIHKRYKEQQKVKIKVSGSTHPYKLLEEERSERGLLGKRTAKENPQEGGDRINSTESQ